MPDAAPVMAMTWPSNGVTEAIIGELVGSINDLNSRLKLGTHGEYEQIDRGCIQISLSLPTVT
jgi:hypothetical protein